MVSDHSYADQVRRTFGQMESDELLARVHSGTLTEIRWMPCPSLAPRSWRYYGPCIWPDRSACGRPTASPKKLPRHFPLQCPAGLRSESLRRLEQGRVHGVFAPFREGSAGARRARRGDRQVPRGRGRQHRASHGADSGRMVLEGRFRQLLQGPRACGSASSSHQTTTMPRKRNSL